MTTGKGIPRKTAPVAKKKAKEQTQTVEASSDVSISSDSSDSSTSDEADKSSSSEEDTPEKSSEKPTGEKKAGEGLSIRHEFPKSNIRRWTTPGPRYETPSLQAVREAKQRLQATLPSCWQPECPLQEAMKKSDKTDEGKVAEEDVTKLPIPKHRRRTKSFRPST